MTRTFLWTGLLLLMGAGCQNADPMQHSAADLADKIAGYKNEQQNRVAAINHDYQDRFSQLMANFTSLSDARVAQARNTDAQTIADEIIADNKQTLVGTLRGTFSTTLKAEMASIDQADADVAKARDQYTQSYQAAALTLTKLQTVESDLRLLARAEDEVANAVNLIQHVAAAQQSLTQSAQASSGKTPTTKLTTPKRPLKSE